MIDDLETQKRQAVRWFETLRNNICTTFEQIEHDHCPPKFYIAIRAIFAHIMAPMR